MINKSQDWIENNSLWPVGGIHPPWEIGEICKKLSILVKEYIPMRPHYHVVVMLINLSYARQWLGGWGSFILKREGLAGLEGALLCFALPCNGKMLPGAV